jgi:two-component system NtrC family sensor kinase
MVNLLQQLPSVLVMAALVTIFVSLQRRNPSPRVRYWLIGWGFTFVHFFVSLFNLSPATRPLEMFLYIGSLQLAAISFLISVSGFIDRAFRARLLGLILACVVTGYSALMAWDINRRWPYMVCLALFVYGGPLWGLFRQRSRLVTQAVPVVVMLLGTWLMHRIHQGDTRAGFFGMLLVANGVTAMLFARRFPRATPGVITTCVGFIASAGMWGANIFYPLLVERVGVRSELWNVPNFVVAFGMIVVLLEEESSAAQAARDQLQHFADVTSRLLSGVEVKSYCDHIAQVITQATTFTRVVILLVDEDQHLCVAGHAGVAEDDVAHVRKAVRRLTAAVADELCRHGRPIGKIAVVLNADDIEDYGGVRTTRRYAPNPYWKSGDELSVPLRSRGSFLGLISLDDPRDPEHVTAEEMSKIEMLAADIAVAMDNAAMQRQLVVTERLAGLGQFVRGVAHEMNNPLTAVMGYAELLTDRTTDSELRHGLGVIFRESQRMKEIVGNLLRFAQQDRSERKPTSLLQLLQDILRQRSYEARTRAIDLVDKLGSTLPLVTVDENQLKQVFLNVLSNAFEAVENSTEKRVTVMARNEDRRVVLSFIDTGPGFSDPTRVFDPFFTTKSPGKGTGLGLSICYGVLKQHGGNITARNVYPTGACVTIELPAAKQAAANA